MVLAQRQKYRPMEQVRKPEINPQTFGQLIYDKGVKNTQWRKDRISVSCAWKTGQLHVKE